MNKVTLTGRLTRDPEVRYTQGAEPMCIARWTLAVNRRRKPTKEGEPTADFISCEAFGKVGEFVEKYFRKGMKMDLSGRIQTGSYTNKDGVKVYTTDVIAEDVEFGETKGNGSTDQAQTNATPNSNTAPTANDDGGFMNIPDGIEDELPFN